MKKVFVLALAAAVTFCTYRAAALESVLDIRKRAAQMAQRGQQCAGGVSKKFGIYIISVSTIEKDPSLKRREITELAILDSKKNIASFIGQKVTASEEATQSNDFEQYKSSIKNRMDEFLRGVVLYELQETPKGYVAVCFSTGRTMDMAAELKKQMASLPPGTVASSGIAYVESNRVDLARKQALQNALRLAVEQVLGTDVIAVSQSQNDARIRSRIYAHASGFVENFRVIRESNVNGCYQIMIYAKIGRKKLRDSYAAYMKSFGNPEFYLKTENLELYQTFTEFFTGLGFKLTSDSRNADYIINAFGQYRKITHPLSNRQGTQLTLWMRISDARTGQELLSRKNDPRMSSVFFGTPDRQIETSTQKAFAQIREGLHTAVNAMVRKMASDGRDVNIIIQKYRPELAEALDYLEDCLEEIPALTVQNKKIRNGVVSFSALYRGRMDDLEYFLRNSLRNGLDRKGKPIPYTAELSMNELVLVYK